MGLRPPTKIVEIVDLACVQTVSIKPFAMYLNSPYKDMTWEMRLMNVEEWLQVYEYAAQFTDPQAKVLAINLGTIARSIVTVNDKPLYTDADEREYNKMRGREESSPVDKAEYLMYWFKYMELNILNVAIESVYLGLIAKQGRVLRGEFLCEKCGTVYTKETLPPGSQEIKTLAEVVCASCLPSVEEKTEENPKTEIPTRD